MSEYENFVARQYNSDEAEYESRCPVCGDPADYCLGHGEIGDPAGYGILVAHDNGDHSSCNFMGCIESQELSGFVLHANGAFEIIDPVEYRKAFPHMVLYTCGFCHRSWDDNVTSTVTPVPAARCPFEYEHDVKIESVGTIRNGATEFHEYKA